MVFFVIAAWAEKDIFMSIRNYPIIVIILSTGKNAKDALNGAEIS